jgi:uncharacterized protein with von Willebrand factor type A (vWA) domain
MSNLKTLKAELTNLNRLLEIKAEDEDEKRLAEALLLLLLAYISDLNAEVFRVAFLATLRNSYLGLYPDEDYSDLIEKEIAVQSEYLDGFVKDLEAKKISEAQAKARAKSYSRSLCKIWNRIELERQGDNELTWIMGENENHCGTCPKLHGQTKPASVWAELGLYPKCSLTDCDGSCLCHFEIG